MAEKCLHLLSTLNLQISEVQRTTNEIWKKIRPRHITIKLMNTSDKNFKSRLGGRTHNIQRRPEIRKTADFLSEWEDDEVTSFKDWKKKMSTYSSIIYKLLFQKWKLNIDFLKRWIKTERNYCQQTNATKRVKNMFFRQKNIVLQKM